MVDIRSEGRYRVASGAILNQVHYLNVIFHYFPQFSFFIILIDRLTCNTYNPKISLNLYLNTYLYDEYLTKL